MNLIQEDWLVRRLDHEKEKKPFKPMFTVSIESGQVLMDNRQLVNDLLFYDEQEKNILK